MKDVNKVILVGRLGSDPVSRETKQGKKVVQLSVATARYTRRKETDAETAPPAKNKTDWHTVAAWGKQGEACAQFLKKGSKVYIEGELHRNQYTAKDGNAKIAFEIQASSVNFL